MARPKPTVFTVAVGPSRKARAELKAGIERLLAFANLFLKGADALARVARTSSQAQVKANPTMTAADRAELEATMLQALTSFAAAVHQALTFISEDRPFIFGNWPEWTKHTLKSLHGLLATRGKKTKSGRPVQPEVRFYVRRCRECTFWMTVQDERIVLCNRVACQRAVDAKRRVVDRRRERDAQRRAFVEIRGTK